MPNHTTEFLADEVIRIRNLTGPGGRELTDDERKRFRDYSLELAERVKNGRLVERRNG